MLPLNGPEVASLGIGGTTSTSTAVNSVGESGGVTHCKQVVGADLFSCFVVAGLRTCALISTAQNYLNKRRSFAVSEMNSAAERTDIPRVYDSAVKYDSVPTCPHSDIFRKECWGG
jgi:hypothetical protein